MTLHPMRLNRTLLPALVLTLGLSFTMAQGPVQAQVVNDPADSLIPLNESRPELAPKPGQLKQQAEEKKAEDKKPVEKVVETPPLKPMELDPQLDLDPPEISAPAEGEPLKAKAVMVDINSNNLNYDKDRDVYVATGSVHMVISEQNSELHSDKLTYDQNQNLVIAEGNVIIVKNGERTNGSYAKIDLSRKSALINDYRTSVEKVRIKAKTAFLDAKYVQYENGRIVISPEMLQTAMKSGSKKPGQRQEDPKQQAKGEKNKPASLATVAPGTSSGAMAGDDDLSKLAAQGTVELQDGPIMGGVDPLESNDQNGDGKKDLISLHVKRIDVHRDEYGYNRIVTKWPSLSAGRFKLLTLPSAEFSYDEPSGSMEYLGPDIGYDPDYGGLFLGPGWDFKAGHHGSIRISPLLTYGGGGRRSRGGASFKDMGTGPGVGGVIHYRDPKTMIDLGYNTRVGQPVMLADRKLFDGKTRLIGSVNEDYVSGFLGFERPGYGVMIADERKVAEFGKMQLSSYASAGYFKDEFFPNYDEEFFVDPKAKKPAQAGRIQLQAELRNTQPLLQVGKFLDFGFRGNIGLSGYTTGDFAGLFRAGPTMNLRLGNRFQSNLNYYYAVSAGDTPFVFDSYYRGRQNVIWSNAFKVNDYVTLGIRSNMSLMRDNAKNSLFTGNALYMLVGPKQVKLNLAYDVIRKRSYFGINFIPSQGGQAVDFDQMRIFQPNVYDSAGP